MFGQGFSLALGLCSSHVPRWNQWSCIPVIEISIYLLTRSRGRGRPGMFYMRCKKCQRASPCSAKPGGPDCLLPSGSHQPLANLSCNIKQHLLGNQAVPRAVLEGFCYVLLWKRCFHNEKLFHNPVCDGRLPVERAHWWKMGLYCSCGWLMCTAWVWPWLSEL